MRLSFSLGDLAAEADLVATDTQCTCARESPTGPHGDMSCAQYRAERHAQNLWSLAGDPTAMPDVLVALEAILPWAAKAVAGAEHKAVGERALRMAEAAITKARGAQPGEA